jgi:branched-chain amino acid transport system substrate-binding protein
MTPTSAWVLRVAKFQCARPKVLPIAALLAAVVLLCVACAQKRGPSAKDNGDVVIGADLPLSGPLAAFGGFQKWGYQRAVDTVNSQGGIQISGQKRLVRLVVLDDATNPNTAVANVETLVSRHGAVALLGSCTPQLVNAGAIVAERLQVPMVTGCDPVQAFLGVKKWQWVWDLFFYEPEVAALPFETLRDGAVSTNRRVAVLHDNGPDGAIVGGQLWPEVASNSGYTVVANISFPIDATNFDSAIQQVKSSGADIVLVDTGTPQAVSIRRQMAAAGLTPKVMVFEKGGEPAQFGQTLKGMSDGALVGGYWDPSLPYPGAAQLAQDFEKQTGETYSQHIADSFTAAQVLLDALARAGSTDPQKVNSAIARTNGTFPVGHVSFEADHAARLSLVELQWQNGKTKVVWPKQYANSSLLFPVPEHAVE